jgi:hypothetical protein
VLDSGCPASVSALQGFDRPPAVRIHPCGRLDLAVAGLALVGLRGPSEDRARYVAPLLASALPACRFGGVPVFPTAPRGANRRLRLASPGLARPFRARRRYDPEPCDPGGPPGLPPPTALPVERVRSPRAQPGPATFRPRRFSRPRRLAPHPTSPGLFHPGNAPGVSSSGHRSSPGSRTSLEAVALLPFAPPAPLSLGGGRAASEPCSSRRVRTGSGRTPLRPRPS